MGKNNNKIQQKQFHYLRKIKYQNHSLKKKKNHI